ncbi:glutathione S-transferase family protein (plasmid) [Photobacterium sp. DA100]|uniref:glutathione S-transferase family protein n=1 Tax=Photobacterium sp. DA100 TaxID=3027472 RepID=UPI00247996BD|nr:glutathione S-transferase family protein [Photobacterium sp. DA100]WEM44555.1 glutathione S-transferase family protein [Photobacterium sp. DA100]
MLKVVSFKICPFVQRVTAALAARNIPYEIEFISLKDKPQWFLDISPNGQAPLLITDSGTALFESDAIIEYIEDQYGPLETGVTHEQRALDRAWGYLGAKNYMTQCGTMSSKNEATFEQRNEKFVTAFTKVEKQLSGQSRFFKSDSISNVDIAWLPLLHRAHIIKQHTGYDFLCGLPKTKAWQQAVMASGLVEQTVAEDFEQHFTNFYLSDNHLKIGNELQNSATCAISSCCG